MQRNFTLYIPENCKPQILKLLKEFYQEKIKNPRKRDRMKSLLKEVAVNMNLKTSFNLETTWEQCIKHTESCHTVTIFDFMNELMNKGTKHLKLKHGMPRNQETLERAIYTALVKSLLIQFANEPNIYKCVERLFEAVPNAAWVTWQDIDLASFNARIKQHWAAFHQLIFNSPHCYHSHKSLFNGIGMSDNDFTEAFFREQRYLEDKKTPFNVGSDVLGLIGSHLTGPDLNHYRQTSRATYNAVEKNSTLRIQHRLSFISKNILLQEFIGRTLFVDKHYLLTDPSGDKFPDYHYRFTQLKPPYSTITFGGFQSQRDKMIGGYVYKDQDNFINILTAFRCSIYPDHFEIQKRKVMPLQKYNQRITIQHNPKDPESNYDFPIWEREAIFHLNDDDITVNIKFEEYTPDNNAVYCYPRKYKPTGLFENYQVIVNTADFDESKTIIAKKL